MWSRLGRALRARVHAVVFALALVGGCHLDDDGPCLFEVLYLVEDDLFTPLSGGYQTLARSGKSSWGTGWRPDIEPRAKSQLRVRGFSGEARLLWNDVIVEERSFGSDFAHASESFALSHTDPDGTRVELHIYARPQCGPFPTEPLTRAEVEEAER